MFPWQGTMLAIPGADLLTGTHERGPINGPGNASFRGDNRHSNLVENTTQGLAVQGRQAG